MTKILSVAFLFGLLAVGKYWIEGNPLADFRLVGWLATAGLISSFATLLSLAYILARKWAFIRLKKKNPDFLAMLRDRERCFKRNSMLPLVSEAVMAAKLAEIVIVELDSTENPDVSLPKR